jgi:hypothetical protein
MKSKTWRYRRPAAGIAGATVSVAVGVSACGAESPSTTASEKTRTAHQAASGAESAFLWSSNATSSYTANTEFQSEPNIPVTHISTGHYVVAFPNMGGSNGGDVQVTTYGGGNQRCKVQDWWSIGTTLDVEVACYAPSGTAADSRFTVNYVLRSDAPGVEGGYVWAFAPVKPSYDATSTRSWNSTGGAVTIQRWGAGGYTVTLGGQNVLGGTAEVTAVGMDSHYCEVGGWGPSGNDQSIDVACFATDGTPADTMFDLLFSNASPNGTAAYTYAWASDPFATSAYSPDPTYQSGAIASCPSQPTPGPVTITPELTGVYAVDFPGMPFSEDTSQPFLRSNVKVSAYGFSGEYCGISGWGDDFANGAVATIACFDASGNPVNSFFTVTYSGTLIIVC